MPYVIFNVHLSDTQLISHFYQQQINNLIFMIVNKYIRTITSNSHSHITDIRHNSDSLICSRYKYVRLLVEWLIRRISSDTVCKYQLNWIKLLHLCVGTMC